MERTLTKEEARTKLIDAFLKFARGKNNFNWVADWFVRYIVARSFQTKTFDKFVDFMYEKHYDILENQEKLYNEYNYSFFSRWNGLFFEDIEVDPKYMTSFIEEFIAEEDKEDFIDYVRENHCYIRMITLEEAKEKVAKRFTVLSKHKTYWSDEVEWFIQWNVENNFQTKSFKLFVEWLYYCEPKELEDNASWDFFFVFDVVDGFVNEDEQEAFLNWIKEKKGIVLSK